MKAMSFSLIIEKTPQLIPDIPDSWTFQVDGNTYILWTLHNTEQLNINSEECSKQLSRKWYQQTYLASNIFVQAPSLGQLQTT